MTTLVLGEREAAAIEAVTRLPNETAGVLLATAVTTPDGELRLLGRQLHLVEDPHYLQRSHDGMSVASEGYVPALGTAERLCAIPIWFHTHPGPEGRPIPSNHDRLVDRQIADLFRLRANSVYYGTLISSPRPDCIAFTGALHHPSDPLKPISQIWRTGDDWRLIRAYDQPGTDLSPAFDRSIRAYGADIQRAISELDIAVVGCGGTGSAVVEQLIRLGARKLLLIDDDTLSVSNITRVYGSVPSDIGKPKAEVLRDHALRIAPDAQCHAIVSRVTLESTARRLIGRDLVFGCTDDNAGRLVLSRLPTFLLTPVIDVGVLLSSDPSGKLTGIDGRVTVIAPYSACLVCRDRIDLARAGIELLTPRERIRLQNEGYAPSLPGVEPAVITFTTVVAATAVSELLERMSGYGPRPRPSEILLRFHEREISTNDVLPRPLHYCGASSGKHGAVDTVPFLEQTWSV
jgi:molybdopterin/thiamine biosynthesis adenylyltransferase/proteasome lid subunit RPN8/RPN11